MAPLGEVTRVNPENRSLTTVGKIVTLGEVVADAYEEQTPSEVELQFTARQGGDDAQVVRGYFPRRA
jgi:hypothetical protein